MLTVLCIGLVAIGGLRSGGWQARAAAVGATEAAMHSWAQSIRHQPRETSVRMVELAPPPVATDLTPGRRDNPRAIPLDALIRESMDPGEHGVVGGG